MDVLALADRLGIDKGGLEDRRPGGGHLLELLANLGLRLEPDLDYFSMHISKKAVFFSISVFYNSLSNLKFNSTKQRKLT